MIFAKIGIRPPKSKVVNNTTTKVDVIIKPAFGARLGFIYKLKANAIAPLMLPLNHMIITCFKSMLVLNFLQIVTRKKGMKTPNALAIIQEIKTAKKKE